MKKTIALFSGLLLTILLAGGGCSQAPEVSNPQGNTEQQPIVETVTTTEEVPTTTPATSTPATTTVSKTTTVTKPAATVKPVPAVSATKAYTDALTVYRKSGYYLQFEKCHSLPGTLTMKRGTKFMLDNRDNVARQINVSKAGYTLHAYGYAIATAPQTLGVAYITCDGGGSAQIHIEK